MVSNPNESQPLLFLALSFFFLSTFLWSLTDDQTWQRKNWQETDLYLPTDSKKKSNKAWIGIVQMAGPSPKMTCKKQPYDVIMAIISITPNGPNLTVSLKGFSNFIVVENTHHGKLTWWTQTKRRFGSNRFPFQRTENLSFQPLGF